MDDYLLLLEECEVRVEFWADALQTGAVTAVASDEDAVLGRKSIAFAARDMSVWDQDG